MCRLYQIGTQHENADSASETKMKTNTSQSYPTLRNELIILKKLNRHLVQISYKYFIETINKPFAFKRCLNGTKIIKSQVQSEKPFTPR